jgi:NitT/TauT family transport system ATP-binding protein
MESVKFTNTALPDLIELKGISQSYDKGKNWVIKDFNLLVEDDKKGQGQFIVILGKSGCGKSTILKYLAGLQNPTEGEVLINGQTYDSFIPMVFQQYSSIEWLTVMDNVMLPLKFKDLTGKQYRAKAIEMLQTVGLLEHKDKYAQQGVLSGGQLQRVAIARSLMADPKILLMDEPFGALDVNTRYKMQLMLAKIWETLQSVIIFVTHDIAEAVFLADKIFVMDANPGRVIKEFKIDLGPSRQKEVKRTQKYVNLVAEVEDFMFSLIK